MTKMVCVNNTDYEDCMTVGKAYEVEVESISTGHVYRFLDDNGDLLQTMIRPRFREVED